MSNRPTEMPGWTAAEERQLVAAVQMHGCKWAQLARLGVVAGRSAKAMRTNYARLGDAKRMRLVAELTQASAAGQTTARWGTASASDTAAAAEKAGREEEEAVAQRGAGRGKAAAARQCAEEDETVEVDAGRRGGELGTGAGGQGAAGAWGPNGRM